MRNKKSPVIGPFERIHRINKVCSLFLQVSLGVLPGPEGFEALPGARRIHSTYPRTTPTSWCHVMANRSHAGEHFVHVRYDEGICRELTRSIVNTVVAWFMCSKHFILSS